MGPPPGINKSRGPHRDAVIPKMEGRMEIYARKLREYYFREGVIPDAKVFLDPLRERAAADTIEKCIAAKEVPGKHCG